MGRKLSVSVRGHLERSRRSGYLPSPFIILPQRSCSVDLLISPVSLCTLGRKSSKALTKVRNDQAEKIVYNPVISLVFKFFGSENIAVHLEWTFEPFMPEVHRIRGLQDRLCNGVPKALLKKQHRTRKLKRGLLSCCCQKPSSRTSVFLMIRDFCETSAPDAIANLWQDVDL